jgi:hypothetical protein
MVKCAKLPIDNGWGGFFDDNKIDNSILSLRRTPFTCLIYINVTNIRGNEEIDESL